MKNRADHQKGLSHSELGAEVQHRPSYSEEVSGKRKSTDCNPSNLDSYKPQITLWLGGSTVFSHANLRFSMRYIEFVADMSTDTLMRRCFSIPGWISGENPI